MREDAERWRGPATVIARESQGRFYLSWRGQVVLVAREQMRLATSLEAAAATETARNVAITGEQDDRQFHNVANDEAQPKIKKVRKR